MLAAVHEIVSLVLQSRDGQMKLADALKRSPILLACGVLDESAANVIVKSSAAVKNVVAFDSHHTLQESTRLDGLQADR